MGKSTNTELIFHDLFSPLPTPEGWASVALRDMNSVELVKLYEGETRLEDENHVILPGNEWLVTKGAIARAYREEMERIVSLAKQIAPRVVLYTKSFDCLLDITDLTVYNLDQLDTGEEAALFSRKVNRLLRRAVELCGKNPNPFGPLIFHRKYWEGRLHTILQTLLKPHSAQLAWINIEFIPAFSTALKELHVNGRTAERALVFRHWVRSIKDIPELLIRTRKFIEQHKADWNLEFYRETAAFLEQLNGDPVMRKGSRELKVLFFQRSRNTAFLPICIGMTMPGIEEGYPIALTSGEVVRSARPPWNLGQIIDPKHDEA